MALKKSDLYSSLWASCDELRGGMDASQYKDYVLVLLFMKYVSDKWAGQPFAPITIPEGSSFSDLVQLKGKADIGDQINKKILGPLFSANNLSDPPDFDDSGKLGSGREKVDRLTNLIAIFEDPRLDFSKNRADGDDILGDAYEYLMRHFATESGKSKGQFYTPAEVSRVIARLIGINSASITNETTVYDPTCGSGSLLLKVVDEAHQGSSATPTVFGQEKDQATAALARMNMILHNAPTAEIKQGNTITDPQFKSGNQLKTFDFVIANPPFSDKRWSTGLDADKEYGRFDPYGKPPPKQGDYAYLLHIIASLKATGSGACILPHGVLFRGNAEAVIRKNIIERRYIKAIVGLPANLFYGTGIPACIIVLEKKDAKLREGIFMIDASKGFIKDGNKNRLRERDIHLIIDAFERQLDLPGFSRLVPFDEIEANDFNLNLPRYIDSNPPEDLQDIEAHLRGGIPKRDIDLLDQYWKALPELRTLLFEDSPRPGYFDLAVDATGLRGTISQAKDVMAFKEAVRNRFDAWLNEARPKLDAVTKGTAPKILITDLAESLLSAFEGISLLDPYELYQHLMSLWASSMQDDVYMVAAEDWVEAVKPHEILQITDKDGKKKWPEPGEFIIDAHRFKSDLLPISILGPEFFAKESAELKVLKADQATLEAGIADLIEEQAVDGGVFAEEQLVDRDGDKIKVEDKSINAWLRENKDNKDLADEKDVIEDLKKRRKDLKDLKDTIKRKQADLDKAVGAKYLSLGEDEVRDLVVSHKWIAALRLALASEISRAEAHLVSRLSELQKRYCQPLPSQVEKLNQLSTRFDQHLRSLRVIQ